MNNTYYKRDYPDLRKPYRVWYPRKRKSFWYQVVDEVARLGLSLALVAVALALAIVAMT